MHLQMIDFVQTTSLRIMFVLVPRELEHEQDGRAIDRMDEEQRADGRKSFRFWAVVAVDLELDALAQGFLL
jgi:hypothetical protein